MSRGKVVIIGGGFAGISALGRLYKLERCSPVKLKLVLIDRKENFEFLPMLPDIIGGWVLPSALKVDLKKFCRRHNCDFVNDKVVAVDAEKRRVILSNGAVAYDYLLIASGSETNFFDNEDAGNFCHKLDDVSDGIKIRDGLLEKAKDGETMNVAVIGGGYTGVEIAANVKYLFRKKRIKHHIYILEKAADILTMVPHWIRKEVGRELKKINIEVVCNDSFKQCDGKQIFLQSGARLESSFCIWAAGVRTAPFVEKMNVMREKSRIKVAGDLQVPGFGDKNVFAAGDAAWFFDNRKKLRLEWR